MDSNQNNKLKEITVYALFLQDEFQTANLAKDKVIYQNSVLKKYGKKGKIIKATLTY